MIDKRNNRRGEISDLPPYFTRPFVAVKFNESPSSCPKGKSTIAFKCLLKRRPILGAPLRGAPSVLLIAIQPASHAPVVSVVKLKALTTYPRRRGKILGPGAQVVIRDLTASSLDRQFQIFQRG